MALNMVISAGRVLTQHSEKVWAAERPFAWLGIDVNGRGAVIKLSDGSLWVHSPVNLDPELKAAVDALGTVKYIVTPNYEHNKFAPQVSFACWCKAASYQRRSLVLHPSFLDNVGIVHNAKRLDVP